LSERFLINHFDIVYGLGLALSAPVWLMLPNARRKVFDAFRDRMGHVATRDVSRRAVMIHAVSVGEMNATTSLVAQLRSAEPGVGFLISSSSIKGHARAIELYSRSADVTIIRFPLDFSEAVTRVLDRLQPSLVVLISAADAALRAG
jgi:3-deoxy-D-manno-octulosonic-acid transferase